VKNPSWNQDLVASYDRTAERYAERFLHELDHKPFDRELLDNFADAVRGRGQTCDLGCGPGHVARYLKARGVDVFGLDISPGMIEVATRLNPDILFRRGDMLALDFPDQTLSGVVAFYSLIHLSRESALRALQETYRVLLPNGLLLLSVHGGEGELHVDEFLGISVSIDATLFQPEEMARYVRQAGFAVDRIVTRQPYEFEFQSTRIYISAMKKVVDSNSIGDPARYHDLDHLERGLAALPGIPKNLGRIALIVRRREGGWRDTPDRTVLAPDTGLPGDAWSRLKEPKPDAQITAMQIDVAELIANGQPLALFGDNLFLELDLSEENLPPGSQVRVGCATLEVTPKPHNGCQKFRARFGPDAVRFVSKPDLRHRNLRGIYMRVLEGGEAAPGDPVEVIAPATRMPAVS